jgi:hypothetical protein
MRRWVAPIGRVSRWWFVEAAISVSTDRGRGSSELSQLGLSHLSQVILNHELNQFLKLHVRFPSKLLLGLARIPFQSLDIRWPE